MEKEEFNLSEKMDTKEYPQYGILQEFFYKEDVKKFIRLLKEKLYKEFVDMIGHHSPSLNILINKEIDKLVGDKFIEDIQYMEKLK